MKTKEFFILLTLLLVSTQLISQTKETIHFPSDYGDEPFTYVEKMPTIPGGNKAIQYFINNYPYPSCGLQNNIQGIIILQFIVERNGNLSDARVLRSPDQCLSDAALEYLKESPLWEPGTHNGKAVRCYFTLPIDYNIKAYNKRLKKAN